MGKKNNLSDTQEFTSIKCNLLLVLREAHCLINVVNLNGKVVIVNN